MNTITKTQYNKILVYLVHLEGLRCSSEDPTYKRLKEICNEYEIQEVNRIILDAHSYLKDEGLLE